MKTMENIDIFHRIEMFRARYRKQYGYDLEISISTDVGEWEVNLGMEGWATKLGGGKSRISLTDAWEEAVMSLLFEHGKEKKDTSTT